MSSFFLLFRELNASNAERLRQQINALPESTGIGDDLLKYAYINSTNYINLIYDLLRQQFEILANMITPTVSKVWFNNKGLSPFSRPSSTFSRINPPSACYLSEG